MNRTTAATLAVLALSLTAVGSIGCVPVDFMMRQPLVAQAVDRNSIVKEHRFAENSRGLPVGAMSDSASMTRVSDQDICFDVTMHELDPIDMQTVRAKLTVQNQVPREQAQLWPEQPVTRPYNGLVPERVQTGYETYCAAHAYNGVCLSWATRPTYGVVMRPGQVNVYETRARMCFPNGGFISNFTENVVLELTVPRPARSFETTYTGWGWAWGAGDKRTRFAWGFTGFEKKK